MGAVDLHLSRRERQIMDVMYRRGTASAVRATLRILEEKGHLTHRKVGPRYVYAPTRSRRTASRSAV